LFVGHGAQNITPNPSKSVNSVGCHMVIQTCFVQTKVARALLPRLGTPPMGGSRGYPSEENAPVKGKAHAETDTLRARAEPLHGFSRQFEGFIRVLTWHLSS
jgi:hypothetical protein